jgi:peptidoglycan hydrolase-like protein with peptidoglycan-binding domain
VALSVAVAPATALANSTGGTGLVSSKPATKKKAKKKTVRRSYTRLGQRTLRQGMHGKDVRLLQGYLTVIGYRTSVDGAFGPLTRRSVAGFEQANSLTANGVATVRDQRVLRTVVAQNQTSSPTGTATINSDGTATAPAGAPTVVQQVIAAANQIIDKPYVYGGGHKSFNSSGYDCSGAVSYALHGGGLLASPEPSTGLESFGAAGAGTWITVYANGGHAWVAVAGIAFDTANYGGPNIPSGSGPRWRRDPTGNLRDGTDYVVRHPAGY